MPNLWALCYTINGHGVMFQNTFETERIECCPVEQDSHVSD